METVAFGSLYLHGGHLGFHHENEQPHGGSSWFMKHRNIFYHHAKFDAFFTKAHNSDPNILRYMSGSHFEDLPAIVQAVELISE